jgi:glycosyltransferase involved in cell wall biosynthesis
MMDKPALAMIANVPTPYRTALHLRIAREIPQFALHSLFTHATADFNWENPLPTEIRPISFARPNERVDEHPLRSLSHDYRKARRVAAYLAEHDVRVVVLMGYNDLTRVWLTRYCRRNGIKLFLRGDANIKGDNISSAIKAAVKYRLVHWFIRQCDGVMPMGGYGQQYFEKYGADPKKCFWVPYEPDYNLFANVAEEQIAAFRAANGLDETRRFLLYCGRLVGVKRVDLLIDAFSRIADRRSEWDLLIAGDGILRSELEQRVPPKLANRVKWLGFCDVDRVRLAYHAADVMVLPSDFEPWAVVVNEAMAAGLVVVASDVVGAAAEMVQDGRSGRLFPTGNLDALTEVMMNVTDASHLPAYKEAVAPALQAWRERADPVEGIRQALRSVGLLDNI